MNKSMNIGSLYLVKKYYWMLFPTKELAVIAHPAANHLAPSTIDAAYWSKRLNCEVTYFSQETLVVFLEEEGKYKKVLTSDGMIGWTWFIESYNECFEEVKANP